MIKQFPTLKRTTVCCLLHICLFFTKITSPHSSSGFPYIMTLLNMRFFTPNISVEVHNPTWFPNLKYIDTFCAQKCCSSLALKVTVRANDTEGRKGELIRVLSTGSPASLSDRPTLYLNKMCSITRVLRSLWGKKTLFPFPWRSTKIVQSYHLSQTWGYSEKKKKMFHEPRTQLHWVLAAAAKAIRMGKILKGKAAFFFFLLKYQDIS